MDGHIISILNMKLSRFFRSVLQYDKVPFRSINKCVDCADALIFECPDGQVYTVYNSVIQS